MHITRKKSKWSPFIEVGFVIFLFYSNMLMAEYTRSGPAHLKGLLWAIKDIFTIENFLIAVASALVSYVAVEYLRKKL